MFMLMLAANPPQGMRFVLPSFRNLCRLHLHSYIYFNTKIAIKISDVSANFSSDFHILISFSLRARIATRTDAATATVCLY